MSFILDKSKSLTDANSNIIGREIKNHAFCQSIFLIFPHFFLKTSIFIKKKELVAVDSHVSQVVHVLVLGPGEELLHKNVNFSMIGFLCEKFCSLKGTKKEKLLESRHLNWLVNHHEKHGILALLVRHVDAVELLLPVVGGAQPLLEHLPAKHSFARNIRFSSLFSRL